MEMIDLYKRQKLAHVIIDTQFNYACRRLDCRAVTERIIGVTKSLRVPTIMVYMDPAEMGSDRAAGGIVTDLLPYADSVIAKTTNNAFQSSDLEDELAHYGVNGFLASGFNIEACVSETVRAGRDFGYQVGILSDCVGSAFLSPADIRTTTQNLGREGFDVVHTHQFLQSKITP